MTVRFCTGKVVVDSVSDYRGQFIVECLHYIRIYFYIGFDTDIDFDANLACSWCWIIAQSITSTLLNKIHVD